ncbi:MAG: hypothetical protein RLZZ324_1254 [Candidatus Parcubacteria bacterium]|jgi:CheY-like chemotaxis protein
MDKKHLLLIDDDGIMLQLFGGQFASAGYEVLYAHDGAEGWEMARSKKPDIILCDFRMPNMDGLELGGRLKAAPETKDIPLVMLTSEDFSADVQRALKDMGVADYLHKSLAFPEMLERVKKIVAP